MISRSALASLALVSLVNASLVACVTSSDAPVGPQGFDGGSFDGSPCGVSPCVDSAPAPADAASPDSAIPDAGQIDAPVDGNLPPDAAALLDVYVDPTAGADTNVGTAASPFKTIKQALTKVPAGSTVWLADGSYTAANQGGVTTLALPAGAALSAKTPGLAVIEGFPFTANLGSNVVRGVVFAGGSSLTAKATLATAPLLTIDAVSFTSAVATSSTLSVGGNVRATVTKATFSGPLRYGLVNVSDAAELTFVGGSFDAGGVGAPGFGASLITVTGTSKLTLNGVSMKNSGTPGIGIQGSTPGTPATVVLTNGTLLDTVGSVDNCAAAAAIILASNADVTLDGAEIKNSPSGGLCVRNGFATHTSITLTNGAKLTNDAAGIVSETGTASDATIVVNGATFASNKRAGIYWSGVGSLDISNATFTGNGNGLELNSGTMPLAIKIRNSTLTLGTAAGLNAIVSDSSLALDLGTVASPGNNTITGNATAGVQLNAPAAQNQTAVGNTWNAGVQAADGAGHYTAGTSVTGPATGTNYRLVNASTLTL